MTKKNRIFFDSFELYLKIDIWFIILEIKAIVFSGTLIECYPKELKWFFIDFFSIIIATICVVCTILVYLDSFLLYTFFRIIDKRNTPFFEIVQKSLSMKCLPFTFQLFYSLNDLTIERFLVLWLLLNKYFVLIIHETQHLTKTETLYSFIYGFIYLYIFLSVQLFFLLVMQLLCEASPALLFLHIIIPLLFFYKDFSNQSDHL